MATNAPRQTIFSFSVPWWATVLMAVGCYTLLKYFIPTLQSENPTLQGIISASPTFAPLVAIPFLLLAAKQLYDVDLPEKQDETTEGNTKDEFEE